MNKILESRAFAIDWHGNKTYGDDKPYSYHLDKVFQICAEYIGEYPYVGDIPVIFQVAYLHDILEDTVVSSSTLLEKFGKQVTENVQNVTDAEGNTRAERKINTWHKIRRTEISTFVKLCDRIANIRERGKIDMYRKEHPVFKAALYVPGRFEVLWTEMETILGETNV